ncbi:hypothetical protein MMC28_003885 [Mycoblastus sanguinarius]|nr:hypothetical protein [Mycoblastus sanguinarius]
MSDNNEAGDSSNATNPPPPRIPDTRSRYLPNPSMKLTYPELYSENQTVYLNGPRGVDPNPYKIHQVLGDGQYHLWRNGRCDRKVYKQENLQLTP